MTVIEALKNIIKDKAILADGKTHSHAIITEKDPSAKLTKLTISDLEDGHLVIGLDAGRIITNDKKDIACMSPIFKITDDCSHNRACDAVLLEEKENGKCKITYIELKSDSPSGYVGQFQSSSCFMLYIKEILNKLCDIKMDIMDEKFVVFHTDKNDGIVSINKKSSRPYEVKNPKKIIVRNGDTKRITEF